MVIENNNSNVIGVAKMDKGSIPISRSKIQEATKKSLKIVEQMLEESVTEEWLINACESLSQSDYLDAVEERSIINMCGYPLCSKQIKNMKQKYHISVRENKVYDLTERKHFCSNLCFKASNFLKTQLPDCPIWLKEENVPIQLLSSVQNRGSAGDEVDVGRLRITKTDVDCIPKDEPSDLSSSVASRYLPDSLENCAKQFKDLAISEESTYFINPDSLECELLDSEEDTHCFENAGSKTSNNSYSWSSYKKGNIETKHDELSINQDSSNLKDSAFANDTYDNHSENPLFDYEAYKSLISDNKYMPLTSKKGRKCLLINAVENISKEKFIVETFQVNREFLTTVENALREWISEETFLLLLGQAKFDSLKEEFILQNASTFPENETKGQIGDKLNAMEEAFIKICSKLNREEFIELNNDEQNEQKSAGSQNSNEQASLSDCVDTPAEAKVAAFYKGQSVMPGDSGGECKKIEMKMQKPIQKRKIKRRTPSNCLRLPRIAPLRQIIDSQAERAITESFLPRVDSLSQKTIRKQLVVGKLKIIYLNILPLVGLHYRDISEDLRNLVLSFRLSPTNISFKPAEWKMMAVILLRMLEKMSSNLCLQEKEKRWQLLQKTLMSFYISINEIDRIIDDVTDPGKLVNLRETESMKIS